MNRELTAILLIAAITLLTVCCARSPEKEDLKREKGTASATPKSHDTRPVIAAFGDSLTAGAGVNLEDSYPAKLQQRIDAAGYHYKVANAGVSGETSAQGLNRIDSLMALQPEIVIVELGANDGLRGMPVEMTLQNLNQIVRRLKSAEIEVVLAGMQIPPNYGPAYTRAFRDVFTRVAREHDVPLIPFFLDGVGGQSNLNQEDGIHPTARGYDIIVDNVWKVLEPLLRRNGVRPPSS